MTEEGLASLMQMVDFAHIKTKSKFLYKPALNYYTCYQASKLGFVDLFNDLEKFYKDPQR